MSFSSLRTFKREVKPTVTLYATLHSDDKKEMHLYILFFQIAN